MTHVPHPEAEERLYLQELVDGNIVIEIWPNTMPLAELLELVAPIIGSIEFG